MDSLDFEIAIIRSVLLKKAGGSREARVLKRYIADHERGSVGDQHAIEHSSDEADTRMVISVHGRQNIFLRLHDRLSDYVLHTESLDVTVSR